MILPMRGSVGIPKTFDISTGIGNTVDDNASSADVIGNGHTAFETDQPQAWPEIITLPPAFREGRETQAKCSNLFSIVEGADGARLFGYIFK